LLARYARGRGPFTTREAAERFGVDERAGRASCWSARIGFRGELRPGGTEREWCDPDVLRRIRRATLAVLRREVEPAEQAAFGRFLPAWHGIGRRQTLREALVPLQAVALPVSLWESDVLPRRVPEHAPAPARPALRDRGSSGSAQADRVAIFFREDGRAPGSLGHGAPEGEVHDRIREALAKSAEFWFDLLDSTGLDAEAALPALWELVWAGEVTNDAWTPLRAGRRYGVPKPERRPRRFSRRRATAITATQGRWSLTGRCSRASGTCGAGRVLERQGIVNATASAQRDSGAWPSTSRRWRRWASAAAATSPGLAARPALGGAASGSGAVCRRSPRSMSLSGRGDPAQSYGAAVAWPKRAARAVGSPAYAV
jgi:ATP-dependent Lhr-like helicase